MEGTSAGDGTSSSRVGGGCDLVVVLCEVGHIGCGFSDSDGKCVRRTHDFAILSPINEGVSCVGGGRQGDGITIVISSCASNGSTSGWVSRSGNLIAINTKVGHISCGFGDVEVDGGIGRDRYTVFCPINKGITRIGCNCQGAGSAIVVITSTRDGTSTSRVGRCRNLIAVEAEVGHKCSGIRHDERVACVSGDHRVVFSPIDEGITWISFHRQCASVAIVVRTCACDDTGTVWIGRCRNHMDVLVEVGHIGSRLRHDEIIACVGGDHRIVPGPVDKGVAWVGHGFHDECVAVDKGAAVKDGVGYVDGAAILRFGCDGDLVGFGESGNKLERFDFRGFTVFALQIIMNISQDIVVQQESVCGTCR